MKVTEQIQVRSTIPAAVNNSISKYTGVSHDSCKFGRNFVWGVTLCPDWSPAEFGEFACTSAAAVVNSRF